MRRGVGTKRKGIACQTNQGDIFVGPDNGVFLPAISKLGGYKTAHELTNPDFMIHPVSDIFHGRDIFSPAAAHLSNGVPLEVGKRIPEENLIKAPYQNAQLENNHFRAKVIQINHYGSIHLNITHDDWDQTDLKHGHRITIHIQNKEITMPYQRTFGEVKKTNHSF